MPFGLKNTGASYQRAMTAIFHNMLHEFHEDYVNDIIAKSLEAIQQVDDLRKVFLRCKQYKAENESLEVRVRILMKVFRS